MSYPRLEQGIVEDMVSQVHFEDMQQYRLTQHVYDSLGWDKKPKDVQGFSASVLCEGHISIHVYFLSIQQTRKWSLLAKTMQTGHLSVET